MRRPPRVRNVRSSTVAWSASCRSILRLTPKYFSRARAESRTKSCGVICSRVRLPVALGLMLTSRERARSEDPLFFAMLEKSSGDAVGYAAFMRIEPAHRVIEVGSILFTPRLQRTVGATEAMYLMARYVFEDLGYRRYEWKCNALNAPSRRAALRLGFTFEGIFRQHMIVKGRNRDTAWFSMLDSEWPKRKAAFERWLDPANFDANGRQRVSLSALNREVENGGL